MTMWIEYLTNGTVIVGPFVDETDGWTPETGLTVTQADILLSKNGQSWAQISGTSNATHGTQGYYGVAYGTADTDTVGRLQLSVSGTAHRPVYHEYMVVAANSYDSIIDGTDYLDVTPNNGTVDVATAVTSGTVDLATAATDVTNMVTANATQISGSATAADNLEASALGIVTGQAAAGTLSTTQMTTNLTEATNDHYNGRVIVWTSGVLAGQASAITDYDGSTKLLTYLTVTEAPSASDTFVIV